jgi:hypothetical protein
MFERVREVLQRLVDNARAAVAALVAVRDAADAAVAARQADLAQQTSQVAAADAQVTAAAQQQQAAQSVLDARNAAAAHARDALDTAERRLGEHLDNEPDRTLPNGHPNPAWGTWNQQRIQLAKAVDDATTALTGAAAAAVAAAQGVATAAAGVAAAQAAAAQARQRVDAAQAAVLAAQAELATAEAGITQAQADADAAAARVEALAGRAARLVAEPLDRPDLERAADAELADLLATLTRRHATLARRAAAVTARATVCGSVDTTVDELSVLGADAVAVHQAAGWPSLVPLAAAIDAAVSANAAQRTRPAVDRRDDLAGLHTDLTARLQGVLADLAVAAAARDRAATARARAVQVLANHQRKAP